MDNSSTKSILETINETISNNNNNANPSALDNSLSSTSSNGDGNGWFSSLFSIPMTTWIIILVVFAFVGFNIFIYLAKGTQDITNLFTPIIEKILGFFNINNTASPQVVNEDESTNTPISAQGNKASSSVGGMPVSNTIPQPDIMQNNTLNKALNNSNIQQTQDYEADEASSSVQTSQHKKGYCYIGEERGYRSCMPVSENDVCMSGDIFPTSEICINPSLRA